MGAVSDWLIRVSEAVRKLDSHPAPAGNGSLWWEWKAGLGESRPPVLMHTPEGVVERGLVRVTLVEEADGFCSVFVATAAPEGGEVTEHPDPLVFPMLPDRLESLAELVEA